jgi:phosphatidylserine/phosphatidylglycerophosphate/cardiolipin synthase-like enzyme
VSRRPALPDPARAAWRRFLLRFSHQQGLPVRDGNRVALLLGGTGLLDATRHLIRTARASLRFEIYIWKPDAVGRELAELLVEALERGVSVHGIVDHLGSLGASTVMDRVRAAGGNLRLFHPVGLWRPLRVWNRRNHRKVVVADGLDAVVGSGNWAEAYDLRHTEQAYLDLGLRVRGPSVADLDEDFRRVWQRTGGMDPGPAAGAEPAPPWPGPACEGATVQVVTSLGRFGVRAIRRHTEFLVRQAKGRLWIANAYFIPTLRLRRLLARAARRGVDLRLLLPGVSDNPLALAASRAGYGPLLRAGARILERDRRFLHAKAALLGEDLALVGSANLDSRSFRHNLELNLLVQHRDLALKLEEAFSAQVPESRVVTLAAWEARSWWTRLWQRAAYALRWWL